MKPTIGNRDGDADQRAEPERRALEEGIPTEALGRLLGVLRLRLLDRKRSRLAARGRRRTAHARPKRAAEAAADPERRAS